MVCLIFFSIYSDLFLTHLLKISGSLKNYLMCILLQSLVFEPFLLSGKTSNQKYTFNLKGGGGQGVDHMSLVDHFTISIEHSYIVKLSILNRFRNL